jgi:hypothetical protein
MTTFDERERDFEARYKHDQELQFKVKARRNRLLGMWAGYRNVIEKVCADLNAKGQTCTPAQVQFEFNHFGDSAKQRIMTG